jgi:uncharacterized protein (TIGR03437 family)
VSIYQINVTVPAGLSGNQLVQIGIGGMLSNTTAMAVTP